VPIIASVSEHQPTAWPSFFFDLEMLIFFFPAGVYWCFRELRDEHVFVIIYAVLSSYFAGVMVRLLLVITPVVCVCAAIAISRLLEAYIDPALPSSTPEPKKTKKKEVGSMWSGVLGTSYTRGIFALDTRFAVITTMTLFLFIFVYHCTWVTQSAYSSPSVVLSSRNQDGSQNIIDDFREAYYWLRQNTPEDAVVSFPLFWTLLKAVWDLSVSLRTNADECRSCHGGVSNHNLEKVEIMLNSRLWISAVRDG
jgi:dolichyl-diphosphooligosaccharide--protein glycosyltransferase